MSINLKFSVLFIFKDNFNITGMYKLYNLQCSQNVIGANQIRILFHLIIVYTF